MWLYITKGLTTPPICSSGHKTRQTVTRGEISWAYGVPPSSCFSDLWSKFWTEQADSQLREWKWQIQNFQGSWLRSEFKHEKNSPEWNQAWMWAYKQTSLELPGLSHDPHGVRNELGTSKAWSTKSSLPESGLPESWFWMCFRRARMASVFGKEDTQRLRSSFGIRSFTDFWLYDNVCVIEPEMADLALVLMPVMPDVSWVLEVGDNWGILSVQREGTSFHEVWLILPIFYILLIEIIVSPLDPLGWTRFPSKIHFPTTKN